MSIIDTSGLEDWPDPASLFSAASSLMEHGASFAEHVEGAHSTWKGLGACYETPHQDLLYSALDPALQSSQHASDGCVSVKAAMTLFADEISALKPERDELLKEAASFDAKSIPEDEEGRQSYMDEAVALKGKIVVLVQKYEAAINTCFEQLAAIGDDGLPTPNVPAWSGVPRDTMIAALGAMGESRKVDVERVIRRVRRPRFRARFQNALLDEPRQIPVLGLEVVAFPTQSAGKHPEPLSHCTDRNIFRSSTGTIRPGNRDPSPQHHGLVGTRKGTQFADPHRHVRSRARGRTRPLCSRGRLDLQQ